MSQAFDQYINRQPSSWSAIFSRQLVCKMINVNIREDGSSGGIVLTREKATATRGFSSQSTGDLNALLLLLQLLLRIDWRSAFDRAVQGRNNILQTDGKGEIDLKCCISVLWFSSHNSIVQPQSSFVVSSYNCNVGLQSSWKVNACGDAKWTFKKFCHVHTWIWQSGS